MPTKKESYLEFETKRVRARYRIPDCPAHIDTLGLLIRGARLSLGYGLRQLAKKLDISAPYLSQIETGRFKSVSEELIVAIAKELCLNPDEILALAGKAALDIRRILKRHSKWLPKMLLAIDKVPKEVDLMNAEFIVTIKSSNGSCFELSRKENEWNFIEDVPDVCSGCARDCSNDS